MAIEQVNPDSITRSQRLEEKIQNDKLPECKDNWKTDHFILAKNDDKLAAGINCHPSQNKQIFCLV